MGLVKTMSAIGTALGPSLGGVLIAKLGWRAIFLVNLPLGILSVAIKPKTAKANLSVENKVEPKLKERNTG